MSEYLSQKYYQNYFTILEISETGLYDFDFSPDSNDTRRVYLNGVNITLDASSKATVYLRTGTVPLYVRTYADCADNPNAFKVQLLPHDSSVDEMRQLESS